MTSILPGISAPPVDPPLTAPLTDLKQRQKIVDWTYLAQLAYHDKNAIKTPAQIKAMSDTDLIALYTLLWSLYKNSHTPITGPPNPVTSITDFLNKLVDPALWTRVGEFAVGAILLGVGLHAMTNGQSTQTVKRVGGTVHKSAHGAFQVPSGQRPARGSVPAGKAPIRSSREHIQGVRNREAMYKRNQQLRAREALKGLK